MSTYDDEEYVSFRLDADAEPDRADDPDDDPDENDDPDDPDDDEDDEDDDDIEDATDEEIDFVLAAYREDGQPVVTALAKSLANDLDELIKQLIRLPGDAGAMGFVSLVEEVFVIVRARGRHVQVLLSDDSAAADFPIARDVADYLGITDLPDEDEDSEPMGDLDIFADLGVSSFDMALFCDVDENSTDTQLGALADQLKIGGRFRAVMDAELA